MAKTTERIQLRLWLRTDDAPRMPARSGWGDLRLTHYEAAGGMLPLCEFGTMPDVVRWVNDRNRFEMLGMSRAFGPFDILSASLATSTGVRITAWLHELPGSRFGGPNESLVTGGGLIMARVPDGTEFIRDLALAFSV